MRSHLSLIYLTKYIVVQRFDLYESVNILPIFNLTYVRNPGAAFSLFADHDGWQKYFFIVLAIGISLMLAYFMKKNSAEQKITKLSLCTDYWWCISQYGRSCL